MSAPTGAPTVVRVLAADASAAEVPVPFRLDLRLDELLLVARLAEVPLPVRVPGADGAAGRFEDRLAGTPLTAARELVAEAVARVDDDGPDGARSSLAARDLLDGDRVHETVTAALGVVAAGPLGAVLDVTAVRAEGDRRLRSWFGVTPGLAAQLSTVDGLTWELAWFDPALWVSQLTRAVTVEPWARTPAQLRLTDYVSLPSELLAGSEKAYREGRTDLVPVLAAQHAAGVRLGEPGEVRPARTEEVAELLTTLGTACRGRLRLVTLRRDVADATPAIAAWLLFDDGWHELRPGRRATAVLRRRTASDLGLFTRPQVAAVAGGAEVAS